MKTYRHFRSEDREILFKLKAEKKTQSQLSEILGFSQSAISRELKRNRDQKTQLYVPDLAEQSALRRKLRGSKIDRNQNVKDYILDKLQLYWAPDVIAGRLKVTTNLPSVSTESIYQWLYKPEQKREKLYTFLARRKRKRGIRRTYKPKIHAVDGKISIHDRPDIINNRSRIGDWEGDLVIGKYHKSQILTLSERRSKYLMAQKLPAKTALATSESIVKLLKESGIPALSLTFDNGKEFSDFKKIEEALGLQTYFCDPYASWQKGGIEHGNGIIRRTIPKRTCFNQYSDNDINDLIWTINNTPRRSLAFRTPHEVLFEKKLPESNLCTCN
jgi:IS30 family transposase